MTNDQSPIWKVRPKLRNNARALRKDSTDAERLLWASLRDYRLNGFAFRRQVPTANYIADFVCHAAKLVIELDGGQHYSDEHECADARRSEVMEAKGFQVLRFGNHEVKSNRLGVLEVIASMLDSKAPTPALPRKREREARCRCHTSALIENRMTLSSKGTLRIGDSEIDYRFTGPQPSDAPTIILLHEGLGCAALWGDFPDRLQAATGCGVFAYSRAGYGQSSPVQLPRKPDYMHREALDVMPAVLDAIGFQRGILVGHSDGASIAAIYAGHAQDHRIRGLALIAPHFIVEDISVKSIAVIKVAYETTDLKTKLGRWHRDVDNAFYGWNGAWLAPEFRDWDISESLAYIRVPIAIVQGADDQYGTLRQIEIAQDECYCPVDVTIIPGAAHSPHREAAEPTLDTITTFVNDIAAIDAPLPSPLVGEGGAAAGRAG